MKTYAALSGLSSSHLHAFLKTEYPHCLMSFAFDKKKASFDKLTYVPTLPNFSGMLDSGAHSAWSRGTVIDLDEYIVWSKEYAEKYPNVRITNLDVIPGEKGRVPTAREQKKAVAQSIENANAIRDAGLRVIEVHHLFDPMEAFETMIERRRPGEVIGLGGLNAVKVAKSSTVKAFGDACFAMLRDMCGWDALPPVHGYGVSVSAMGYQYPLASIDASSWVVPQKYGQKLYGDRLVRRDEASRYLRDGRVQTLEMVRILESWSKREQFLTKFWQDRGVNILEEGVALVD